MADLPDLTAVEVVQAVKQGHVSVHDVVEASFARIDELDSSVQAWVLLDRAHALQQADELAARAARGDFLPLYGLPFGVKDIIDVAGLPTGAGFAPYRDRIAARDAAIVGRLRDLGAIPLGKTHTTQFAFSDQAPTNNPYRLTHTPGGSSSGSGAAVGARMVPLALGTQTAGSVLRPAAYCGAVGFKPTFNWLSRSGVLPLAWSLDHLGLITRTVADAGLVFGALTGQLGTEQTTAGPRIGLLTELVGRAEPEIAESVREAAGRLSAAGADVREVRLPVDLDVILSVHRVIMLAEVAAVHSEQLAEHRDDYGPILAREVDVAQLLPAAYVLKARRLRRRIRRELDTLMTGVDAWLLPTATILPPDRSAGSTGDPSFQAPWTMLGTPSISLPSGVSSAGLPIGLQLVGRRGEDERLLAVAGWVESTLGLIDPPALLTGNRAQKGG